MLRNKKKHEEKKTEEEEERQRVESVGKHKEKVAAMGDCSEELQAYVQKALRPAAHTPQPPRTRRGSVTGCRHQQQPARVELAEVEMWMFTLYVQCWMLYALYYPSSGGTFKAAILLSLDDPALSNHWARI